MFKAIYMPNGRAGRLVTVYGVSVDHFLIRGDDGKFSWRPMKDFYVASEP